MLGGASGDFTLPRDDEGGAGAAFVDRVFPAFVGAGGFVVAELFEGFVFVAIVHDGAVIGAEDDEGVFGELETVESLHDLADGPVELDDGVGAEAVGRDALKALVRDARDVEVVGGVEEEEGLVLILFDEGVGLLDPLVSEVFIAEAGLVAAGVEADAGDAIMNGGVVSMGPVHLEGVAMGDSGGMIRGRFFSSNPEGIGGVEVEDAAFGDVDLRDAVVGGGEEEVVVEADLARAGLEFAIPIGAFSFFTEAEVPFADDAGLVAGFFHEVWEGESAFVDDEVAVWRRDSGAGLAEGIGAGEEGVACRGAGGRRAVAAGEALATGGELIDVRGLEGGGSVAGEVTVAHVIGHDDDDVGFGCAKKL